VRKFEGSSYGSPGSFALVEAPVPDPSSGEIRIRIEATALGFVDGLIVQGLYQIKPPLPYVPGGEIAGVVDAIGPGVTAGLSVGDRVVTWQLGGGLADCVVVPAGDVDRVPDGLDLASAAAMLVDYQTAHYALFERAKVRPGETVLVLAGTSGVGQAAIQVARLHGARVIATAGSDTKLAQSRALGADEVVHHHDDDLVAVVRRLTGNRGVDVVIEHVGAATWERSVRSLAPGGRLVTCGNTTGWDARIDLRFLFSRQLSLLGSYMGTKGELLQAAQFFFAGRLTPLVDSVMPLAGAADAHRRLEAGDVAGKLVLTP
jgi:NADPH2:quinone reductase